MEDSDAVHTIGVVEKVDGEITQFALSVEDRTIGGTETEAATASEV